MCVWHRVRTRPRTPTGGVIVNDFLQAKRAPKDGGCRATVPRPVRRRRRLTRRMPAPRPSFEALIALCARGVSAARPSRAERARFVGPAPIPLRGFEPGRTRVAAAVSPHFPAIQPLGNGSRPLGIPARLWRTLSQMRHSRGPHAERHDCCWARLSGKDFGLYENDNRRYRRPHESRTASRRERSATEMTRPEAA
jgi:hypothetical protein